VQTSIENTVEIHPPESQLHATESAEGAYAVKSRRLCDTKDIFASGLFFHINYTQLVSLQAYKA
jgi:hypothetical protein